MTKKSSTTNYEYFICPRTQKKVYSSSAYKVQITEIDVEENILVLNRNCPNVGNCKNCYGNICQSIKRIKNDKKGANKVKRITYIDEYSEVDGEIFNNMMASNYLDEVEIIDSLTPDTAPIGQSINMPWHSYDRSNTWKTDCTSCLKRHADNDVLTPCQKCTQFFEENGVNIEFASKDQIVKLNTPDDCICREQKQTLVKIY